MLAHIALSPLLLNGAGQLHLAQVPIDVVTDRWQPAFACVSMICLNLPGTLPLHIRVMTEQQGVAGLGLKGTCDCGDVG